MLKIECCTTSITGGWQSIGRWYLIASASRNSVADKSKWCVHSGNTASHAEDLPSPERRNARFFFASKIERIVVFIAYIHQNLVNVSNYKDNNFQEMLESFKHLNEKFHGEMRSGFRVLCVLVLMSNIKQP